MIILLVLNADRINVFFSNILDKIMRSRYLFKHWIEYTTLFEYLQFYSVAAFKKKNEETEQNTHVHKFASSKRRNSMAFVQPEWYQLIARQ